MFRMFNFKGPRWIDDHAHVDQIDLVIVAKIRDQFSIYCTSHDISKPTTQSPWRCDLTPLDKEKLMNRVS